jgi:hypothetical protein
MTEIRVDAVVLPGEQAEVVQYQANASLVEILESARNHGVELA